MTDSLETQHTPTYTRPRVYVNHGVVIKLAESYEALEAESLAAAAPLWPKYPKAHRLWEALLNDPETQANWDMANYMVVTKLGYNDHGMTHGLVTSTNAVRIFDMLVGAGLAPDVVQSGAGDLDDACLVSTVATLIHDIGNQLHRKSHELFGMVLAQTLLDRLMPAIYPDVEQRVELRAFILSAILTHDLDPLPLTFEGGLVAVADGTDVTKGRGRMAFDLGKIDIHSVSALAIDEVRLGPGKDVPVEITVVMNNSAGIFQIEDTLTRRLRNSPLAPQVAVVARTRADSESDTRIIQQLYFENGVFKNE